MWEPNKRCWIPIYHIATLNVMIVSLSSQFCCISLCVIHRDITMFCRIRMKKVVNTVVVTAITQCNL